MREENQTIIKALNMFSRVPETWELLNEIERLNNIINELEKYLKEIMESYGYENDITDRIEKIAVKNILNKLKELKEGK